MARLNTATGRWERGCRVPGCDRRHAAHGYCDPHVHRVRRLGHPNAAVPINDGNRGWRQASPASPTAAQADAIMAERRHIGPGVITSYDTAQRLSDRLLQRFDTLDRISASYDRFGPHSASDTLVGGDDDSPEAA